MAWMVYGAYGYTGRLVTERAVACGERPVLAGRSAGPLAELAERHGLAHVVLDLGDEAALREALAGVDLVAHCAGPFSRTAAPMVQACLATGTNYLDITGEIDVFEDLLARDAQARAAGVALLPGSGMDVVPTDCLAVRLAAELPSAKHLRLAFVTGGSLSPGTAMTAVEGLGRGGRARVNGDIRSVPRPWRSRVVPFDDGPVRCTAIPWGDVSTAYHSTGIPNIAVYTRLPTGAMNAMQGLAAPVLRRSVVQRRLKDRVRRRVTGPDEGRRRANHTHFWAEVRDDDGTTVSLTASGPDPYDLTADAVVRIATRVAEGRVASGAHSPAQAHGTELLLELDGVTLNDAVRAG